jgi:adenosylhomocysteinase
MDGYQVMPLIEAAKIGDIFITIAGDKNVIDKAHLRVMKDGAILANSGHFNVEINIPALESLTKSQRQIRPFVNEYTLKDGRRLYLLGEGRLINLAAAEGHPANVMDMSFANQALSLEYMVKNRGSLKAKVHPVPEEIDKQVARLKLQSMGINIDSLTPEQKQYLTSWKEGT